MPDFKTRLRQALQSELGVESENTAQQIVEKAAKYKQETEAEVSAESLIQDMIDLPHKNPIDKWNTVIGRLYLDSWGKDGENPYQI